jgi:hypothetical protein
MRRVVFLSQYPPFLLFVAVNTRITVRVVVSRSSSEAVMAVVIALLH